MAVNYFKTLVANDLDSVNTLIFDLIQSDVPLIEELGNYITQSGGKRLRPILVLLTSLACGYEGKEHIKLAAMVEFFHTATLLHDDVVDESTLRRGKKTANEIWGNKTSILVGDYFFTLYMQLMVESGNLKMMRLLVDTVYQVGCGELRQLSNRHKPELLMKEYFEVIRLKTSLLFAVSSTLGALVNGASNKIETALYQYGLHLGNAFQLIDDALDYCSDASVIGKNIGDDLADGKATLPLLHALKEGTPEQQAQIRQSIEAGTLTHLPAILKAIQETGAIEYTKKIATEEANLAIKALQDLPNSVYKEGLIDLAEYAISRDH